MKAWPRGRDDEPDAVRPGALDRATTVSEIVASGIDLDPTADRSTPGRRGADGNPGAADPGEHGHEHRHEHPHRRHAPDEPPVIGIVGAGAVGTALGVALARAGWPVGAVASRDAGRRARFHALVPGARAFAEAEALIDEVELIVVAVPDDAIAELAASIRLYSGQAIVHTSGALGAEVLAPAMAAGTQIGGFHPLVAFADLERAIDALHGATVAIEGDDDLAALLGSMAEALGAVPVRLATGSKAAYHAAAVLAAGGFIALLDAIAELGRVAGLDEAGSLAIYGRLIEQTLGNARALGIRDALTGPIARGDVGTLRAHLAAVRTSAPEVLDLYRAAALRELELAIQRGLLAPEVRDEVRESLASVR